MWNDDFHHTARVALTGRNEAYYSDYRGTAQELASAVALGVPLPGAALRLAEEARGARRRWICPPSAS